jgi:hypothetical protein
LGTRALFDRTNETTGSTSARPDQQHEQHPRARGLGDDLPATLTSMNNLAEIRPELEELSL